MNQLSLPLYNPRDRGRRNALQNIILSISDELRRTAPIAAEIVEFSVNVFPELISGDEALALLSPDYSSDEPISPYAFEILDLIADRRWDTYPQVEELVNELDLDLIRESFSNVELIGIDESIVDTPLSHSAMSFLKTVAFRMFRMPDGRSDEAVGPIISELRMQLTEEDSFKRENELLGYIRNHFVAYVSALTSIAFGRKPLVVLHGPLVRAIGGFSHITFDYEAARDLLNVDTLDAGEFDLPSGAYQEVEGDRNTENNLPLDPVQSVDGEVNLKKFNEFCLFSCGRQCSSVKTLVDQSAVPPQVPEVNDQMMRNRRYPGFCLYFWVLRSLSDLARLSKSLVTSVVENVSAATEMSRIVLPSVLAQPHARTRIEATLENTLRELRLRFPQNERQRRDTYQVTLNLIRRLNLTDSNLLTYALSEGQYTAPVQVYRYRTKNTQNQALAETSLGLENEFEPILNALFNPVPRGEHSGYRVLMSYVRTTPLREPIRVEYFDHEHLRPAARVISPIHLLSLPYQEYGLPIILYYADKLARTPTRLVRTIIEREYLEIVLRNNFSDPVSIMTILGRLSRGYFQREGVQ